MAMVFSIFKSPLFHKKVSNVGVKEKDTTWFMWKEIKCYFIAWEPSPWHVFSLSQRNGPIPAVKYKQKTKGCIAL